MAVARFTIIIAMLLPTMVSLAVGAANGINSSSIALATQAFTSNATVFAPLAAPLYHNVIIGEAWVFPSSANDLGARDMSCECFNPDGEFCAPGGHALSKL